MKNTTLIGISLCLAITLAACQGVPAETDPRAPVEQVTQPLCLLQGLGGVCLLWTPSPWSGTNWTGGDNVARLGEVLYFSAVFHSWTDSYAIYHGNTPVNFASIGEWNDQIWGIKNNSNQTVKLYRDPSYGGGIIDTVAPHSEKVVAAGASSIKIE